MHVCSIRLACVETVLCSKKVFAEYVDVYLCHVLAPPSGKLQVAVAAMLHFIRQIVFIVFSRWCFGIRQPFSTIIPTANKPLLLPLACPGGWSFSAHLFGASEAASVLMDSVLVVLTGLLGTNPSLRKGGKTRKLMRKKTWFPGKVFPWTHPLITYKSQCPTYAGDLHIFGII